MGSEMCIRDSDELEDEFLEKEEEYTALVAGYVDEHLELFAKIV